MPGYIDPNFPNPGGPKDIPVSTMKSYTHYRIELIGFLQVIPYGYTPNTALAILGVVIFAILTVAHGWLTFRPRKLLYLLPLPIATLLEVVGLLPAP